MINKKMQFLIQVNVSTVSSVFNVMDEQENSFC